MVHDGKAGPLSDEAPFLIRRARRDDASEIAGLFLISSDGLAAHIWSRLADPGQSILEVGKARHACDRRTRQRSFSGQARDTARSKLLRRIRAAGGDRRAGWRPQRGARRDPAREAAASAPPLFLRWVDEVARLEADLSLADEIERAACRFDERRELLAEGLQEVAWTQ
jgi:hypothetical protein